VDKKEFFRKLGEMRDPGMDEAAREGRFKFLQGAWKEEGLNLCGRRGQLGSSFDAQRLISLSRKQEREDQMIEAIYTANHEQNLCLSSWPVLLGCAAKAGVKGAEEMLNSQQEVDEVKAKIQQFKDMGINSVPVLVVNDSFAIHGAPEQTYLRKVFLEVIDKGDNLQWPVPKSAPMAPREFVDAALALIEGATDSERSAWLTMPGNLDWGDEDPRWSLLKERILGGNSIHTSFSASILEVLKLLHEELDIKTWKAALAPRAPTNLEADAVDAALRAVREASL